MRQSVSRLLAVSGLALVASPFCFTVQAQDYIDVEAERRAQEQGSVSAPASTTPARDPYSSPQPARSYPATSYGVNSAPAGSSIGQSAPAPVASSAAASGGSNNLGQLVLKVQQLQQEVMRLNGIVEEQAHELRTLKEQSLERYVDLDRRVSSLTTGGAVAVGAAGASAMADDSTPTVSTGAASVKEQPGEADAYRSAYALVRGQQFDEAVTAFRGFLRQYPSGRYAPNAHYWLGELYLVVQPADLESSRQSFTLLLEEYPDNAKVPDALYKLGRVHYMKGNREKAREYLDRVVREYGDSNNAAARLAQDFINENY
ncbi:tol-pal system protein YbgF [Parahaliea maris]|uniref:Cell division coordinator CpoB n=1 Tax=Parahaliea maris TaxID=2716870 RepID=A0A5C9A6I9_9GAMM|nr:tol-pal system protein YbgF [Parahaliea maris]TXS96555.1 tol-pal system protein YbgF [Parahaliea maris]